MPFRDPKPVILVVCEGEKTEPQYISAFQKACRNPRVRVEIASEHGVPKTVVEIAKQLQEEARTAAKKESDENLAYDSVWCVFDIDDHPNVAEARQMARHNQIDLAVSNPCFELWLLLHFRESPGMQDRGTIYEMLRGYVPDYDKRVEFRIFSVGYDQAAIRARRLDESAEEAGEPGRNPTTGCYRLTELIRGDANMG